MMIELPFLNLREIKNEDPFWKKLLPRLLRLTKYDHIFLVGGYLRDFLLSRISHDLDFVVDSDTRELAQKLADEMGGNFFVLNELHAQSRVLVEDKTLDFSSLHGENIIDDLSKRDFTINALALPIDKNRQNLSSEVIDPYKGINHLKKSLIKPISSRIFEDDPIRLLRFFRLKYFLDFHSDKKTDDMIAKNASFIWEAKSERISDEILKILDFPEAARVVREMVSLEILDELFPEIEKCKGITQNEFHHLDVFNHSIYALECLEGINANLEKYFSKYADQISLHLCQKMQANFSRLVFLKLAALLHDVGKPYTRSLDENGVIRFYDHQKIGVEISDRVARRLKLSKKSIDYIKKLTKEHLRLGFLLHSLVVQGGITRRAYWRFFRDTGEDALDVIILCLADGLATRGPAFWQGLLDKYKELADELTIKFYEKEEGLTQIPRLITGKDIINEFGLKEGPLIGELLEKVEEAQAEMIIKTRREALNFVAKIIKTDQRQKTKD